MEQCPYSYRGILKATRIVIVLLIAVVLFTGTACGKGTPYNLDDYYISTVSTLHTDEPVLLFVTLSWDCGKGGYTHISVYGDSGRSLGGTDYTGSRYDVSPDGKVCSHTERIRYIPYDEAFQAGSRYELVITTDWQSVQTYPYIDVERWTERHTHIIYPQVRPAPW